MTGFKVLTVSPLESAAGTRATQKRPSPPAATEMKNHRGWSKLSGSVSSAHRPFIWLLRLAGVGVDRPIALERPSRRSAMPPPRMPIRDLSLRLSPPDSQKGACRRPVGARPRSARGSIRGPRRDLDGPSGRATGETSTDTTARFSHGP